MVFDPATRGTTTNESELANSARGTQGLTGEDLTRAIIRREYDGVILDYNTVGYPHQKWVALSLQQTLTLRQALVDAGVRGVMR